ncbi:hypothetical protein CBR_g32159 [Chara braunii]|uniref:Uncharacterized protein n=1 Tax=Chara braunii TaxID=69332 RepID=A0A388JN58_CHABU|nr:hypothetical protein CBR_g32159 [Chara braunii]|eukprot:GBG59142.1 hypothetical protein CBR_g32159 [Chara braunii]
MSESCRQQMRGPTTENITNEVSRMCVGSDANADDTRRATGDESLDFHCVDEADDAEELEIRPLGVRGRGRGGCGHQQNRGSCGGRISKVPAGDKGGKHPTWNVEEMLKLARTKWDRQARFDGMPHNYGRMRKGEKMSQPLRSLRRGRRRLDLGETAEERREEGWHNEDDESSRMRKKKVRQGEELEAKSKLWTDGKTFRGSGPGRLIADAVHDCADYYCAIVNGDVGASSPRGLIMPPRDVPRLRIQDLVQRDATLGRARRTENVAMLVIHGWIFKSFSRSDGFAQTESYVSADYSTNLARAVWQSVEWSRVVSPSVVYHTRALRMDIPLSYAGAYIEDRPKHDDMAAHQECTVLCLASCFHDALQGGQWSDNGKMSKSRLSRFGDAFRLLLTACMWIMCMGGDDVRSHEEASYYSQLVAKPTQPRSWQQGRSPSACADIYSSPQMQF